MSAIAKAFVQAKRAFAPALKSSQNPHFRSKYADLAGCLEAVNDALLASGIAVYQETSESDNGVVVETVFLHESGESLRGGKLHVPASKSDAQGYGSALTYARRYSLMAACGIAAEDDDGNAASKRPSAPEAKTKSAAVNTDAKFEAEWLPKLTAAAKTGAAALQEVFRSIPNSPAKVALWAEHGMSLKGIASGTAN